MTRPTSPPDRSGPPPDEVPPLPRALRGRRALMFAGLVGIGLGAAGAAIFWSLLVGAVVGQLGAPAGTATPWGRTVVGLVLLALGMAALVGGERVLAERLGQSWVNDLRVTVFERVSRTPVREHRHSTGATAMRFVGDMTAMRRWAALGLAKLAVGVPMVLGCLVALALASPLIAGAVGAVVLIGFVAIRLVTPQLYQTNRAARRRRAQVAAHVTEHVGNRLVMQAFGREDAERRLLRRRGRRLGRAMVRRAEMIGTVRAVGEATTLLAGTAALAAALAAALVARVDPAAAAASLAVVGILVAPLRDLSRVAEYRASAAVALEKLNAMMARPVRPRPAVTVELPAGPGRLELEGVALRGVLDGISAVVPAGSVVALVGGNGSGKTTLLTVLSGLVAPDAGRVLLDGVDLQSLDELSLRRAIGFAGPDLPLLRGTIADNVRYADPDADGHQLHRAILMSGLDGVIRDLPDGLRTKVGEGGAGLSSGQRQRVALARAVLARPRVLLLDEADAHLDPAAGRVVDRLLAEFAGTVVVVTHRLEQLPGARTVWRLANGRIRVEHTDDPVGAREGAVR